MGAAAVIEINPVANDAAGVLLGFEAVAMDALLFQCPDQAFNQPVLLGRMWRNELLSQSVAVHQCRIAAAGKDEPVVGAQQEWCLGTAQRAEVGNQCVFQGRFRRL